MTAFARQVAAVRTALPFALVLTACAASPPDGSDAAEAAVSRSLRAPAAPVAPDADGVPRDNPVATYYDGPEGYPAWTDAIRWDRVVDMSTYRRGRTAFERFENARDELASQGGGVLYYPAGTYDFTDGPFDGPHGRGLMLRTGVVIRGEAPRGKPSARGGSLPLGTKFIFGFTRRDNALETGERLGVELEGALTYEVAFTRGRKKNKKTFTETRRESLYLNAAATGTGYGPTVRAYARRYNRLDMNGTLSPADGGGAVSLEVEFDVPARGKKDEPGSARFAIELGREGGSFVGTYAGSFKGRGAAGVARARSLTIAPETPRDWNMIGLSTAGGARISEIDRVGIAWVHLVGATVWFGPDVDWGDTWATAGSWKSGYAVGEWKNRKPDGSHHGDPFTGGGKRYVGAGRGRLVFGCVLTDAVGVNTGMSCGRPDHRSGFGPNGYAVSKFAARIGAYGTRVLVANNVVARSEGRNFLYRQTTRRTWPRGGSGMGFDPPRESVVLFDYNKATGIDINKDMLGLTKVDSTGKAEGGYFEEGVVVRDNWVFNNGHKGFNISGTWVTISGNRNERSYLKEGVDPYGIYGWELTLDGHLESSPGGNGAISDNLSRAFDISGRNVWIHDNSYNNVGSDPGNDGEGILCQAHGGTQWYSWAITRNTHERGSGESSYIGAWGVIMRGVLLAWNETSGWVGRTGPVKPSDADMAIVANSAAGGVKAPAGTITSSPHDMPFAPRDVAARLHDTDAVRITWTDASEDEIGFRIDRRIGDGKWRAVAYRPPHVQGSPDNPQAWIDFTAPPGTELSYRVVAIDARDHGRTGARAPRVTIPRP